MANSGLPQVTQAKIFDMHANSADYFKKAYNLVHVDGDVFIDVKMAIIIGEKH